MQFLRTLFWIVVAVFLAIMARNNWSDVTLNLWGTLQADIKLPLLVTLAFLLGFLPTWLTLRSRIWQLKRRLAVQGHSPVLTANPPAVERSPDNRLGPA
uniref:LapA family protein n=1 Tax=uncultured Sphingomonas sp. TaxID=158754 RepID=UPI0025FC2E6F|nr:LapA family protein [uncultured Sphingomonas sp.]